MRKDTGWKGMTLIGLVGAVLGGILSCQWFPDVEAVWISGASLGFSISTFPISIILNNQLKAEYNSAKLTLFLDLANNKIRQLQTELIDFDRQNHRRYLHVIISDLEDYLTEIRNIIGKSNWRTYGELKGSLGTYKTTLTQEVLETDDCNNTLADLRILLRGLPDALNDLLQHELRIKK